MIALAAPEPEVIAFVIPGRPFAWRRARTFGRRHFEDPEQKSWKGLAQTHMLAACRKAGFPIDAAADSEELLRRVIVGPCLPVFVAGPVELVVRAFWPPTGPPRKRSPRPARWRYARPDGDNVAKILMDCSQGILVADDAQYVKVRIEKWTAAQGEAARVEVEVRALDVDPAE